MIKNRMFSAFALVALLGTAACGGDEGGEEADMVTTDTVTTPGTETVTVPTTDTAVVTTEIAVDTAVSVDTAQVGGEGESR